MPCGTCTAILLPDNAHSQDCNGLHPVEGFTHRPKCALGSTTAQPPTEEVVQQSSQLAQKVPGEVDSLQAEPLHPQPFRRHPYDPHLHMMPWTSEIFVYTTDFLITAELKGFPCRGMISNDHAKGIVRRAGSATFMRCSGGRDCRTAQRKVR